MTIDEIIEELEESKGYPASDPASDEALNGAIDIMRKYQKIEQIIKDHDTDNMPEDYWYIDRIREVIEDDNSIVDNSSMRSDQSNTEHCSDSGTGKEQQEPRECLR